MALVVPVALLAVLPVALVVPVALLAVLPVVRGLQAVLWTGAQSAWPVVQAPDSTRGRFAKSTAYPPAVETDS